MNEIDLTIKGEANDLPTAYKLAPAGLAMEFGVASGDSIRRLANSNKERTIYGFDSFKGLPESWNGLGVGHFACQLPQVPQNVTLVEGLFDETLPKFLEKNNEQVAFIHIDCDLYSSTKTIFDNVKNRMVDGCVIVFDELLNYGGETWRHHEYKAFQEFLEETGYQYTCIGKWGAHQAAFKINK
jgi:predicted O-methyltransferase YrrM